MVMRFIRSAVNMNEPFSTLRNSGFLPARSRLISAATRSTSFRMSASGMETAKRLSFICIWFIVDDFRDKGTDFCGISALWTAIFFVGTWRYLRPHTEISAPVHGDICARIRRYLRRWVQYRTVSRPILPDVCPVICFGFVGLFRKNVYLCAVLKKTEGVTGCGR